jgi:thioredoxin-related protein
MHRIFRISRWITTTLVGCFLVVGPAFASDPSIQWHAYETGVHRAKADKKKLFIHFYADWCRYCKKMDSETFRQTDVVAALNSDFIAVRVNSDQQRQIASQYRVRGLPDTWFIDKDGKPIGNRVGYIPAEVLLKIFRSLPE